MNRNYITPEINHTKAIKDILCDTFAFMVMVCLEILIAFQVADWSVGGDLTTIGDTPLWISAMLITFCYLYPLEKLFIKVIEDTSYYSIMYKIREDITNDYTL